MNDTDTPPSPVLNLAGCVVCDGDGRILLIHRNAPGRTQREIPGGKVEPGEDDEAAAAREFAEELGAQPTIHGLLGTQQFTEDDKPMRYSWFAATIGDQHPRLMEPQHDKYGYFILERLLGMHDLSAAARAFLQQVGSGRITLDSMPA